MQATISCLIADDNELDRLTTVSYIRRYPFIRIAGVFDHPLELLKAAEAQAPDVLFLDIDMPGISGLALREKLMQIPACIFITSYPDYAMEGFEKEALDFLVKPLNQERFARTMERLSAYLAIRKKAALLDHNLGGDTVFIKDGHEQVKLNLRDIIYLEALKDYTGIVTAAKKHCVLASLGNLLKEDAFRSFIRIHRSYAVQKHFISRIGAAEITVNDIQLPVGRTYKHQLDGL